MVERVALAINEAELVWKAANGGDEASCVDCPAEVKSRAAIEAMREPTSAMIAEGESAASFGIGKPMDDEAIPRVWKWMIDAALREDHD